MLVAPPRRNDAADHLARALAIGVDDRQVEPVGQPDGNYPQLSVVGPVIDAFEGWPAEDERGELKVEPSSGEVRLALTGVPGEAHQGVYTRIYTDASWFGMMALGD